MIERLAKPFGNVKSITVEIGSFVVEYFDDRAASQAVIALNQSSIGGVRLLVTLYDWSTQTNSSAVDPFSPPAFRPIQGDPVKSPTRPSVRNNGLLSPSPLRLKASETGSPFIASRQSSPTKTHNILDTLVRTPDFGVPLKPIRKAYGSLRTDDDVPARNSLHLDRIASGLELRTTVMLKVRCIRMGCLD